MSIADGGEAAAVEVIHPAVAAHVAEVLDELELAQNYRDWLWQRARPHLGPRVLEIGAGLGTLTECAAGHCQLVIAMEPVGEYVARLRGRFQSTNVEVVQGDARDPAAFHPLRGRIDAAMSFNVLEHIDDDRAVLANVFSSLPPGGRFVCFVPAFPSVYGRMDVKLGHVRRYRRADLAERAREVGFVIHSADYTNLPGFFAWFLNGRLLRSSRPIGGSRAIAAYDRTVVRLARAMERVLRPPFGQSLLAVLERPPEVTSDAAGDPALSTS